MIQTINKGKNSSTHTNLQDKILQQMKLLVSKKNEKAHQHLTHLNEDEQLEAQQLFQKTDSKKIEEDSQNDNQQIKNEDDSQQNQSNNDEVSEQEGHQNKQIKSILKKQKSPSKKKMQVTFNINDGKKQKNEQNYIVIQGTRKWNQKLENPKKGKFDPQQKRTLIQSLSQCLNVQNMVYDDVVKAMSEDDEKIPRNLNFWTKVCSVLPNRTLMSSYKFLKRELNSKNKGGQWTQDQVDQLLSLVQKNGRKWSAIAKEMHRTAENIRDKYRLIGQQKYDPSSQQTVWKFEQLVKFLKYVQKYSRIQFLDEKIQQQVQKAAEHNEIEMKQMKQRKYNSKTFKFHNNEIVRLYISRQFNQIKMQNISWQKISDKMSNKTIFDCRNKFVQLLQLEICGLDSKQFYDKQIVKFVTGQKVKQQSDINWSKWKNQEVSSQEAKNRWMIFKRHIQGRGQKIFSDLIKEMKAKVGLN